MSYIRKHEVCFDIFLRYLNAEDLESGISPLQLAIYDNSLAVVKILIQLDCSLVHLDKEGNSVFHYAAKSSSDMIQVRIIVCDEKLFDYLVN